MYNFPCWLALTVVLLLLSIRLPITEAAPCGCSAEQQKASSLASLILNDTGNSSSSSSSSGKQQATSTPAAPTASFVRIDDMLIPIEDLQPPPARSDGLGSVQASSSSNSNPLPPSSYVSCRGLWPGGVLYYRFSSSFPSSNRSFVRQSLANLEAVVSSANNQKKLITFVEADFFFNVHYVNVINGDACYSQLGRWSMDSSGKQDLSLNISGCLAERTVQHEFMHALGFYHEHSRPDRDSYVTVQWSKIESDRCDNFKRHIYQLPSNYPRYDYSSVMHYRSDSFGCNSSDFTIVTTNGSSIGLSNTSSLDVSKLSYTYSSKNLAYCNSASTTSTSEFSIRLLWMAQTSIVTVFVLSILDQL